MHLALRTKLTSKASLSHPTT